MHPGRVALFVALAGIFSLVSAPRADAQTRGEPFSAEAGGRPKQGTPPAVAPDLDSGRPGLNLGQPPDKTGSQAREWTSIEVILSCAILVFALVVLGLQTYLIVAAKVTWEARTILRMLGLTLIICGGLFLITAGYSADQVAPMMGLLGAVAGYLLGSQGEKGT